MLGTQIWKTVNSLGMVCSQGLQFSMGKSLLNHKLERSPIETSRTILIVSSLDHAPNHCMV